MYYNSIYENKIFVSLISVISKRMIMVLRIVLEMSLGFIFMFFNNKKSRTVENYSGLIYGLYFFKYYLKEALEPPTLKIASILDFCPLENIYIPLSSV
jgi:hypothetical protein